MQITFLEAGVPLVKTYTNDGNIQPYPLVSRFTSHTEDLSTLGELHEAIVKHARKGHCLLKGVLDRELSNESRKQSANRNTLTEWVCLDFDGLDAPDIDTAMSDLGLGDVSYIIQYSASQGKDDLIHAHVFFLLEAPTAPMGLKAWLMEMNLKHYPTTLNSTNMALRWPLDVTTCQNDKLVYIAPPRGSQAPQLDYERIQLVIKTHERVTLPHKPIAAMKKEARARVNELRQFVGMDKMASSTTRTDGEWEVQNKAEACAVTGVRADDDFVRLNVNGGDSWAYWHPVQNPKYIHDFKTGLSYVTKEFLPDYWAEVTAGVESVVVKTEGEELIWGFTDNKSAKYYKARVDRNGKLHLNPAINVTQIHAHYMQYEVMPPKFVSGWDMYYDPNSTEVFNPDELTINTHKWSEYSSVTKEGSDQFPTIKRIIEHAIGDEDGDLYDHFINWFACIFQRKHRPITAWVWHGVEGTGKGFLFNRVLAPLLHPDNTRITGISGLNEKYNRFVSEALLVFVDEVSAKYMKKDAPVAERLRSWITEPKVAIREMRSDEYIVDNYTAWIFASNDKKPIVVPPTDRRYNVAHFQKNKITRPDLEKIEAELECFARYLLNYEIDPVRADTVKDTVDRQNLIEMEERSGETVARWIKEGDLESLLMEAPDETDRMALTPEALAYANLCRRLHELKRLTREQLYTIFNYLVEDIPRTPATFTKWLRGVGIQITVLRFEGESKKGVNVKWRN